jgi:hypothetical protein
MAGLPPKSECSVPATRIAAALVIIATAPPTSAALERPLADALPAGRASCHARVFAAAELNAQPGRRVEAIAIERSARDVAAGRKWSKLEEFDGTAIVSATVRVRFRADPVTHSARLECFRGDGDSLVCENRVCAGGELRIGGDGRGAIKVSIGGTLKSGRFIGHYIHLDDSCEGRAGGPLVLESGDDERSFSLAAAPKEACR